MSFGQKIMLLLSVDATTVERLLTPMCFHLQDTCGSIWQHLDRQHARTRSHLLVDELLLGARLLQPRVWSQHHLCSVIQTCGPALHLRSTNQRKSSRCQQKPDCRLESTAAHIAEELRSTFSSSLHSPAPPAGAGHRSACPS